MRASDRGRPPRQIDVGGDEDERRAMMKSERRQLTVQTMMVVRTRRLGVVVDVGEEDAVTAQSTGS